MLFKKKWNIENTGMILIKHLQMNRIPALNSPYEVDMSFKKTKQTTLPQHF